MTDSKRESDGREPTQREPPRKMPQKMPHYASLDGLRGLAVIIVLLAHMTPLYKSGAFGVDIFFVLSGFLITSILTTEELATGTIAIGRFYARRFLRLLPALWLTIGGIALGKLIRGTLDEHYGWEVLYAGGYVMNWVYALDFDESVLLTHTWSLAIEEQFYLIWPLILLALASLRLSLAWRAAVLTMLAAAVMVYRSSADYDFVRIYRGFDTHCDGLLIGSALALAGASSKRLPEQLAASLHRLAPVALAILVALPVAFGWDDLFTVKAGYSLVAILSGLVIWSVTRQPHQPMAELLTFQPLVHTGKLSYGLYLYHWPLHMWFVTKSGIDNVWLRAACCLLVSYFLAWLSFTMLEQPALRLKNKYFASPSKCP